MKIKLSILAVFVSLFSFSQIKIKDLPTTTTGSTLDYLLKDAVAGTPGSTQKISIANFITTYSLQTTPGITGLTTNYIPKATSSSSIGNSVIYQLNNRVGIGTTTPASKFEVFELMKFDSVLQNTSLGYLSQNAITNGVSNVSVGKGSLQAATTGYENTAIGHSAMSNANGNRNAAVGISCLPLVTGDYNVAMGYGAGRNTTAGIANVAIGDEAMSSYANGYLNTGRYNVGISGEAVLDNETGWYNIGIGDHSLFKNRTSYGNVAIGSEALRVVKYGYNTALGFNAAIADTSGTNNLFLGAYAGKNQLSVTGKIYIGTYAYPSLSKENNLTPIVIQSHETDSSQTTIQLNGFPKIVNGSQGNGKVLTSDANGVGTWTTPSSGSGTVTSIATGNGITGGTITTTGTLGLSGATGDIGSFSGTNTYSAIAGVSAGSYLRSGGVSTLPVWSTTKLLNAGTANYIPYWTSTNTQGENSLLTFDGTIFTANALKSNASGAYIGSTAATSATPLYVTLSQNSTTGFIILNSNAGSSAYTQITTSNGTASPGIGVNGTGTTGGGAFGTPNMGYFGSGHAAGVCMAASNASGNLLFFTGGSAAANSRVKIDQNANVILNNTGSALATTATNGFTYIPTCAGTPTGVPATLPTGALPIIIDSTNNRMYIYSGGAWVALN